MQDRQYSEQNNPLFSKSSKSEVDEQPKKKRSDLQLSEAWWVEGELDEGTQKVHTSN